MVGEQSLGSRQTLGVWGVSCVLSFSSTHHHTAGLGVGTNAGQPMCVTHSPDTVMG